MIYTSLLYFLLFAFCLYCPCLFVLSDANLADFEMYNVNGFVIDDRPQAEYSVWRTEPCMSDCKDAVKITMRASVFDVTPDETASELSSGGHPASRTHAYEEKPTGIGRRPHTAGAANLTIRNPRA